MKNFFVVFALFCAIVFFAACGGETTKITNEQNSDDPTAETGDSDADTNSQDSENQNDEEISDFSDSADDSDSDKPDSDDPDTTPDSGDTVYDDDADITDSDDDTNTSDSDNDSDDSGHDNDADTEPTDPCVPNPCLGIENSTEICNVFGNIHTCECKPNYYWDGSACGTVQTQTASCTGLPDHAEWNTVDSIIQTWDEYLGTWVPTSAGSYNEVPSANQCRYKCKENYSWVAPNCVADTRPAECTGLPENAEWWNSDLQITQTWNETEWQPTNQATFSDTSSPNNCYFKCNSGHEWNRRLSVCAQPPYYDSSSGLTWSAKAVFSNAAHSSFVSYCEDSPESGYSDWRLPNIDELKTLITNPSGTPRTKNCEFSELNNYFVRSDNDCLTCTESCNDGCGIDDCPLYTDGRFSKFGDIETLLSSSSWGVRFDRGSVSPVSNSSFIYVRCVRGNLETRTKNCPDKPTNTVWNDDDRNGTFTQVKSESGWGPAYTSTYSTDSAVCHYKCISGHDWNYRLSECEQFPQYDSSSGLTWSAKAPNLMNWNNADSYCDTLTESGYSDWRLPTISELRTLIQNCPATQMPLVEGSETCPVRYDNNSNYCIADSCRTDSCNGCYSDSTGEFSKFGDIDGFWSSSSDHLYAWFVHFENAYVGKAHKTTSTYVRCVRNAE